MTRDDPRSGEGELLLPSTSTGVGCSEAGGSGVQWKLWLHSLMLTSEEQYGCACSRVVAGSRAERACTGDGAVGRRGGREGGGRGGWGSGGGDSEGGGGGGGGSDGSGGVGVAELQTIDSHRIQ